MFDAIKPISMLYQNVPCVVIRAKKTPKEFKLMIRITGTKSAIHHRGKILWIDYREALDGKTKTPLFRAVWEAALKMQTPPP